MKKFFLLLFLVLSLTYCTQQDVEEVKIEKGCFGFGSVVGLKNIEKNRDLNKKDKNREKIIDKLYHQAFNSKLSYTKAFKKIQKNKKKNGIDYEHAVFYLKNDNNEVISMMSGLIDEKNGRFTVLITSTLEEERNKGHLKTILKNAFVKLYNKKYNTIDVFLDSDILKNDTDIDENVNKREVIKKFKSVVGEELANPIIKDFIKNKKSFGLLSKITDKIEEKIELKKQNNGTNNFAIANHFVKKHKYMEVALDNDDARFDDYYIKPYVVINEKNAKKIIKQIQKENKCIVEL